MVWQRMQAGAHLYAEDPSNKQRHRREQKPGLLLKKQVLEGQGNGCSNPCGSRSELELAYTCGLLPMQVDSDINV